MNVEPDAMCDGGDLDCGSGLLLIIREAMQPLAPESVLEVRSREISVKEDLPAWCRMVGHEILGTEPGEHASTSYFVRKQGASAQDQTFDLEQDKESARDYVWRARIRSSQGMQSRAYVRNHAVTIGQPASFDTEDVAPSAIEFLLSALGGCLAAGLRWRASRKSIELRHLEISLQARAENILVFLDLEEEGHPGLCSIEGTVYIDTDDANEEQLATLLGETIRRSPVAQTLLRTVDVKLAVKTT